jgi:hypothetical protein
MIRKTGYLAALAALVVMGCAGHDAKVAPDKQDGKTFWSHRYQYVRLVPQDHCPGQDAPANSHPKDLDGRLRAMLESLRIDLPEQEKDAPVFTRAELEKVIAPLLRAFSKAAPNEDVALAIEGMHPGEYGLQRSIVTARLFVQNGDELNVIFNKLHVPVNDYDTPLGLETTDYRLNPFLPGSRCKSADKKFPAIIATNVVRFHDQAGFARRNWMVVSLSAQPQQPVPTPMPMTAPPEYQAAPQPAPPAYQTVPQAAPPAYQPPRQTAPPTARDATRMTPAPDRQADRTILERLQILKDLRVQGLITEQEYQEKKKEILDSL